MAIIIGTSGYDYPEWVGDGVFYPPSLAHRRSDWLTYYASQFPIIELNFTFYGTTDQRQVEAMLKRIDHRQRLSLLEGEFTPRPDFTFVIKAYASLTHNIASGWENDAAKFKDDIAPLRQSGKLTGVLAQFPSRFKLTRQSAGYCVRLAEALAPAQLIVEPRDAEWFTEHMRSLLAEHGVVLSGVDAPEEAGMPRVLESAVAFDNAPLSYIRMHGRREGSWWSGDAASRYEYNYADYQLTDFARRLTAVARDTTAHVLFNNHRHADAAQNARRLAEIVDAMLTSGDSRIGT